MQNGSTTESTDTQAAAVKFKNVSLRYSGAGDESLTDISFTVKKGQTIARVGSTGYSTGSHLHFGIRSGGSYVNPSNYVSP